MANTYSTKSLCDYGYVLIFVCEAHYAVIDVAYAYNQLISIDAIAGGILYKVTMTEEGLLSLEKKKKKKRKRHLEEVTACPERSIEEMESHKTHKKKKKKSRETEKDDHRPAETQREQHTDKVQKKTKRKREADNGNVSATVVKEKGADTGISQNEEVKKKKKKRSDEETASAGENTQAEVTFTQVKMDSEAAPQEPVKRKSKKASKKAKVSGKEIEEEEEGEEIVDDAVRAEILEFYPNYKFADDRLKKTIRYDLPRLRMFKDQGECFVFSFQSGGNCHNLQ